MKKFSKILVPTDLSDESNRALEYALTLGSAMDLDVLLLHVVDSHVLQSFQYSYGEANQVDMKAHSHEDMAAEVKKVMKSEMDKGVNFEHAVKVTTHARFGLPYDEIVKMAVEKGVDFIVMGAKGRSALEDAMVGSVAHKVARRAPCPVMLVRKRDTLD